MINAEIKSLSAILFEIDPANCCCVENDAFDEYDNVAGYAVSLMNCPNDPLPVHEALIYAFSELFFEGALSKEVARDIASRFVKANPV